MYTPFVTSISGSSAAIVPQSQSVVRSFSGGALFHQVNNTSNTASSTAYSSVEVAGSTASDAYFRAAITGGKVFTWGIDNSDFDAFVLSENDGLGTSNRIRILSGAIILGASASTSDHQANGNSFTLQSAATSPSTMNILCGDTQNDNNVAKVLLRGYRTDVNGNSTQVEFFYGTSSSSRQLAEIVGRNTSATIGSTGGRLGFRTLTTGGTLTDALVIDENQIGNFSSGVRTKYSAANVTTPTDAELDSAFGAPATLGSGFLGVLNDNAGGTNEWIVWTDGTNWFYAAGTKAL